MPPNTTSLPPQSPLRIKQDGKFYERLLTRESSQANPSFRYYGPGPGSVPFDWESQPGTPKDVTRTAAAAVPTITPPPSYHQLRRSAVESQCQKGRSKARARKYRFKRIKISFIAGIFRRLAVGSARRSSPSVQVSSSRRWLFSSVAPGVAGSVDIGRTERHHEPAKNTALCFLLRPSPWMLQLRGFRSRSCVDGWA